jgi:hypothetical protein
MHKKPPQKGGFFLPKNHILSKGDALFIHLFYIFAQRKIN